MKIDDVLFRVVLIEFSDNEFIFFKFDERDI